MNLRIATIAAVVLNLFVSLPRVQADQITPGPNYRSAGCFIKLDDYVLMVRDTWSKRLSLPGGGRSGSESSSLTAEREVFEETGLRVAAREELFTHKGFVLHRCTVLEPVTARRARSYIMQTDVIRLPVPASSRNEVEEALFVKPADLAATDVRFPSQLDRLKATDHLQLGDQGLKILESNELLFIDSPWISKGLTVVRFMQQWDSPLVQNIFHFLSFLGDEPFLYVFVPFFFLCYSPRFGSRLMITLLLSALINGAAKTLIHSTRPYEWDAALQWGRASGFGLPSGHAQSSATYWWVLAFELKKTWTWLVITAVVLGTGLSRIYLGVHFPQDVVTGWFFAITIVFALEAWFRRTKAEPILNAQLSQWILWLISSAIALSIRPHPETVAVISVWLGLLTGLRFSRNLRRKIRYPASGLNGVLRYIIGVSGLFAIAGLSEALAPVERSFPAMLFYQICRYGALGVWMGGISFALIRPLEKV